MITVSLLDKARRVEGLARTFAEGALDRREREQTNSTLDQLETALSQLIRATRAARSAEQLGLLIPDIDGIARAGLANLTARAGDGLLPSRRVLQGALNKLNASRTALDSALAVAWRPWATAKMASLAQANKTFATPLSRRAIDDDIQELNRLATRKPPTREEIEVFSRVHTRVDHELSQLTVDHEVAGVLARFISTEILTLADLSDAELYLLRTKPYVAEQIELRRR